MICGLDRDEGRDLEAELLRVEERHPALDDTLRLEALDALPARGLRQADALADLGNRNGRIFLEDREDTKVSGVHLKIAPCLDRCFPATTQNRRFFSNRLPNSRRDLPAPVSAGARKAAPFTLTLFFITNKSRRHWRLG